MTRDPANAAARWGNNVEIARADFTDPASLDQAFDGATTVFLLTSPGPTVAAHDTAAIAAAQRAGVGRIVKLSVFGADAPQPLAASAWHIAGERALTTSNLAWTLLRPAGFASNALQWAPVIRSRGVVDLFTADGKHAFIDPRDVAAVAAQTLTSEHHAGKAYTLTGPEPLSARDQIAILAGALGRAIETRDVALDALAERSRAAGVPEVFIDGMIEGYGFMRDGKAAASTDTVERLLGRPPRSFATWARDHLSAFQ